MSHRCHCAITSRVTPLRQLRLALLRKKFACLMERIGVINVLIGAMLLSMTVLLSPGILARVNSDGHLHRNRVLTLNFLRVMLGTLGLVALVWHEINAPRRRNMLLGLLILL